VEFAGWEMPLQYEGILAEHRATRTATALFDTCHMGRFFVTGPGALDSLDRLLTLNVQTLADGQCRYGFLLREDGGILDDLVVYRFDRERWLVVVNAGTRENDAGWMRARLGPNTHFDDATFRQAKIDVQGPTSLPLLEKVLGVNVSQLGRFRFLPFTYAGEEALVSRTGYTGEPGCEVYVAAEQAPTLWDTLLEAGARPAGLGARDVLRLEAGLSLYGHELSTEVTPVEAGLERYASKQTDFLGRAALEARRASGPTVRLIGFKTTGRQSARTDHRVLLNGTDIGRVTSGVFSPMLGHGIGFAYVAAAEAQPGRHVTLDTGRNQLDAELVTPPFYQPSVQQQQTSTGDSS